MTSHSSARERNETPHAINSITKTLSDALKRRAQSVIEDKSIDAGTRAVIRYGLEVNDPWLAELVGRVDAGETIIDELGFLQTAAASEDDSNQKRLKH